jgi:hypothetical protein
MFWSKTWFLLVTFAGALSVAVAVLAARPLQRDMQHETGARLEEAQHSASLLLKVNARKWIDTAAQVATDAVLVEALEQATKGPADLGLVHKTVQERLRYFNDKMKVDLVMATDAHGRVIARAGLDENVYKDGVEGFPLVADALRGLRGDDTWSLSGKLYRVAASPVIARDRYAGALVVGQEVAGELAQSMKRVLDVDVAFLLRGRVLASSAQLSVLSQLPMVVEQHAEELAQNGRSAPIAVDEGGEPFLMVVAPFTGEAEEHKAAYALIVPRAQPVTVSYLASQLAAMDPKAIPWIQLAPVAAVLVLALIIGLLLMRLEVLGPLKRLSRESQSLARGEITRLDDDRHPGKFGTVARALNTTLDRIGTVARVQQSPPPRGFEGPRGFDGPALRSPAPMRPDPFAPRPPEPGPLARPDAFAPTDKVADQSLNSEFDRRATVERVRPADESISGDSGELRATDVRPVELRQPKLTPIATAAPGAPTLQAQAPSPDKVGPDFVESPRELLTPTAHKMPTPRHLNAPMPPPPSRPPPPPPIPMPMPSPAGIGRDPFEDQTAVASPSEALLRAARDSSQILPNPVDDALETEFRQVYRDFIETKQACGEPIDGITYDKFSGKLKSNRQQLISRYACKTVKFQVYVKDGKAALKATPVTS